MNNLNRILAVVLLVVLTFILAIALFMLQVLKNRPAAPKAVPQRYEVIQLCQTLAATKTQADWKYADCVNELMNSLGHEAPKVRET